MDLQIINPITYPGWDNLLISCPEYSFFHSSAWAKVLAESYGYTPLYFTVIENGKLQALVPMIEVNSFLTGKRGVSLPFTDFCDPIILNGAPFPDLLKYIIEFGKNCGWKYIEFRGGQEFLNSSLPSLSSNPPASSFNLEPLSFDLWPSSSSLAPPSSSYFLHTLDLTQGEERTFSDLRDSTRRNIKKAMAKGAEIEIFQSLDSVQEFYRLNCITRKDHGLPPQPYSFFKKVYEHVLANNFGFVVLAYFDGKPIAGEVYFHLKEKAVYKYGASDKTFQHLRANNLVMWEGIRECIRRGCTILSLGRTDLAHEGLLQFKRGWAATEQQINYYRYNLKKETFVQAQSRTTGFHNRIFKNMPVPILNKVGALLYRHFA